MEYTALHSRNSVGFLYTVELEARLGVFAVPCNVRVHAARTSFIARRELRRKRHITRTSQHCAPVRMCLQTLALQRAYDGVGVW